MGTRRAARSGRPHRFTAIVVAALVVATTGVMAAPAAHGANRTGRMFTGDRSGDVLYAALHAEGLASQPHAIAADDGLFLRHTRITAPVHCAPPDNKPTTEEKATCAGWLERDLQLAEPHLRSVLALGSIGWDAFLRTARAVGWQVPRPKPRFGHGAEAVLVTDSGRQVRLLGSYHVSQQNTFTGKLTEPMLDAVLGRAARLASVERRP